MSTATLPKTRTRIAKSEIQLITFYVDNLLLGVDINQVKEINRHTEITPVPHAPQCVSGVINLRGDVVTVVNLRSVLHLPSVDIGRSHRNVIVNSGDEHIGLLVDRVADVVSASSDDIEPAPSNVNGIEGSYFKGVYKLDEELLVILDVERALSETVAD